jgi:hypothetical protein
LTQSLLIRVSSVCECATGLFLLHSICCVAGLLSSLESVPIFFPAHTRRIPRSQKRTLCFRVKHFGPGVACQGDYFLYRFTRSARVPSLHSWVSARRYLFLPPSQIDGFVLILAPSASSLCSRSRFVSVKSFPLRFPFRCLVLSCW